MSHHLGLVRRSAPHEERADSHDDDLRRGAGDDDVVPPVSSVDTID
jgi:hypothetical protein